MKTMKLPEYMPEYTIEKSSEKPFEVKWEELAGWFVVPRLGETRNWGIYDMPSRKCDSVYEMAVSGKARVHGIEGVEITASEYGYSEPEKAESRTFIAQLTDTRTRYLASSYTADGVKNIVTFLDGDDFMLNWGYGEDNCGMETDVASKEIIKKDVNTITFAAQSYAHDIVGRYTVTINGRTFDTVCLIDAGSATEGVLTEQFIDSHGRTVLWRRFNRDDWHFDHYQKKWSEALPENQCYTVNGETFGHWYDCITDYIL